MTLDERFEATKAIADPVARELARRIIDTEWEIQQTTKRVEAARKQVEDAAASESRYSYADSIEGWLRNWRSAYADLVELNHTLKLLNHLARAGEREDTRS